MSSTLPRLVLSLVTNYEAWIIGSAADPANTSPRDFDVIVPFSQWNRAAHLIPQDAKPNTFGGWKCVSNGVEVDVWPGEMPYLMCNFRAQWVWQPHHAIRWHQQTGGE